MMNRIEKKLLTLLALMGISSGLVASYEYDFSNFLADPIVIKINQRRVDNKDYYQIVNSFETVKQVFNNAYCLEKLSWAPWDGKKPLRGGLDLVDKKSGRIPEENQRKFGDQVAPRYAFSPIEIKMQSNEVFQKTAAAATKLLKGIDTMACQVLNEVKTFTGVPTNENKGSGMGGGEKETTEPTTGSNLKPILEEIKNLITNNKKDELKSYVELNIIQLKTIFKATEIAEIKLGTTTTFKNKALDHINTALAKMPATNIDLEHSVIKTSMDLDDFSSFSTSSQSASSSKVPLKDPNKCSFGLGKIGDASGKLAGYTLCKSRTFLIAPKVDKDDLPVLDMRLGGRQKVIAITVEGE